MEVLGGRSAPGETHEFVLLTSSRYIPRAVSSIFPCTVVPVNLVVKSHLDDVDDGGIMRDCHGLATEVNRQARDLCTAVPYLGFTRRTAGKVEKGNLGLGFARLELTLDETLLQPQAFPYESLHRNMCASRDLVKHHYTLVWYTGLTRSD